MLGTQENSIKKSLELNEFLVMEAEKYNIDIESVVEEKFRLLLRIFP
jgi:hypothetical protein